MFFILTRLANCFIYHKSFKTLDFVIFTMPLLEKCVQGGSTGFGVFPLDPRLHPSNSAMTRPEDPFTRGGQPEVTAIPSASTEWLPWPWRGLTHLSGCASMTLEKKKL
jgi:hypothetical protein